MAVLMHSGLRGIKEHRNTEKWAEQMHRIWRGVNGLLIKGIIGIRKAGSAFRGTVGDFKTQTEKMVVLKHSIWWSKAGCANAQKCEQCQFGA